MNWFDNIFRKLYDDLSEEIRLHLEERREQLVAAGMSREDADREAHRTFGNRTLVEERSREVWTWPWIESVFADVRFCDAAAAAFAWICGGCRGDAGACDRGKCGGVQHHEHVSAAAVECASCG